MGTHQVATILGARPTPQGTPPSSWAPWQASGTHVLLYDVIYFRTNHKKTFGIKRHRIKAELG